MKKEEEPPHLCHQSPILLLVRNGFERVIFYTVLLAISDQSNGFLSWSKNNGFISVELRKLISYNIEEGVLLFEDS